MPRILTATITSIFVLSLLIYRLVPVPGAAADSTNYTLTLQFEGVGAVNVNPPNANRGVETVYTYPEGTDMVLTVLNPQPAPGWRFNHWENALTGSSLTGTVHLDANKVVKAVFTKCRLVVYRQGSGQVQVEIPGLSPETLTPPFIKSFYAPTDVTLTAIPDTGHKFKNWITTSTPTTNPITVSVDGDMPVYAVFEQYKLTVNKTGGGDVTVTPPGTTQTPSFTTTFDTATTVTLYADSAPGYAFQQWSNALTGSANPATLLVDGTKTAHANFIVDNTRPVITRVGSANLTVECGAAWTDPGATATDNANGNITAWIVVGGDLDIHSPGTYTVTYNVSDEAANAATQVTRSVTVQDTQAPVITLTGPPVVYLDLNATYTELGATATDACEGPLSGVTADSSSVNTSAYGTYTVTYNRSDSGSHAATQVTREVRVWPKLEIAVTGTGTTVPAAGEPHYYAPGAVVNIAATAESVSAFASWTGDAVAAPLAASTTITMNAAKSITAVFEDILPVTLTVDGEGTLYYTLDGTPGVVTEAGGPVVLALDPEENTLSLEAVPEASETEFWQWLSDDPAINETYIAESAFVITGPTEITAVFAPEGAVDRTTALVEVRGEGTTLPEPGEHLIPKYAGTDLDCIEACQNNTTLPGGCAPCEYAALRVEALPTEDSYFDRWNSVGLAEPLEAESGEIPMIGSSTNIIATFLDRPGLKSLDLLTDLGDFLVEVGVYASAGEVLNLDVDYGGVSVNDGVVYYDENGVPDAAEFALLEAAMKDTRLNLTHKGGLGSEHVWKSFYRNQVQARADLPTASDAAVNVIAAYMTLGSNGHVGQAKAWALAEYGVQLSAKNFDRLGGERLLPKNDADADGVTNGAEWEQTPVVGTPGPAANAARMGAYPANATGPEAPGAEGEGEGEGDDCLDALPKVTITVIGGTVTPAAEVPIGTEVTITASGEHFWYWQAPNSMADESGSPSETFTVTGNVTATAHFDYQANMPIYTNGSLTGSMSVWGREPITLNGGSIWQGNWGYNAGMTHQNFQGGVQVFPRFTSAMNNVTGSPPFTFGSITFTAPAAQGGMFLLGDSNFGDGEEPMFIGSATVPKCGVDVGCYFYRELDVGSAAEIGYYSWGISSDIPYGFVSVPITGEFKPLPMMDLTAYLDGGGGDNPACAGYVTADEAAKYYFLGQAVRITAHPQCGYAFKIWCAENEMVWLDEDDVGDTSKDVPIDTVTVPEVWVKFETVDPTKKEITAVFEMPRALVIDGGGIGWFSGSHAPSVLPGINIETTELSTPSVETVKVNLPDYRILVFNGHGSSGTCTIDDPNEVNFTYFDAQDGLSNARTRYLLVFLNNCSSVASQTTGWLDAFKCDVLVGWDNTVGGNTAEAFDYWFWEAIAVPGTSVTSAVNQSWASAAVQLHRMIDNEPGMPVIIGDGGLILNPCN